LNAGAAIPRRHFRERMNIRAAILLFTALTIVSCREQPASDRDKDPKLSQEQREPESQRRGDEKKPQPRENEIAKHSLAFLRATKVFPAQSPSADCPGCPVEGTEVLAFRQIQIDRTSCAADTCEITVTLRAFFNPGSGATMSGGLTAWIPDDQRNAYLAGHPPEGEQIFRVKIIYKRTGEGWRAVEFDRADSQ
jgi:hypothetical protein